MKRAAIPTLALLLAACASSTPHMAATAGAFTGLAGVAAMAERKSGGCYALCPAGMACDTRTGLCEPARCEGGCAEGQVCQQDAYGARCVAGPIGVTARSSSSAPLPGGSIFLGVPDFPTPAPHHASDKP